MQEKSKAWALLAGPITDAGQLTLGWVINELAGPDGWTLHTQKDLAKATRTGCRKTTKRRIEAMVKQGYLEERTKPIPGVRLTEKALSRDRAPCPLDRAPDPVDRAPCPVEPTGHHARLTGHHARLTGHQTRSPSPSAYLPKKIKDKKEEEEKDPSPSSSPGAEPMVIAGNQAEPISTLPDQPAAQPPAVDKRKLTTGRATCIPDGWEVPADTLDHLEQTWGIPRAFSEALVWEFRNFWTESRGRKKSWSSTFINHAKSQWKREQEHAERAQANQKYRDRSGKPISEADYLARENARRVIADMESGVLDGFDLDTPV